MEKLELSDYYDLLNLHKALMEAKFHDNPDNQHIAGSPIIAKIMNEIVDILTAIDPCANDGDWKTWRKLANHLNSKCEFENNLWNKMVNKVSMDKLWNKYNKEKKIIVTKIYFSPFILADEEIEDFIHCVDNKHIK